MSEPIQIRPYRAGDEAGILDCYNRVFPDPEAGIPKRSLEHWNWKFRDNPSGLIQHQLAVHEDQRIVGIYAGIPVRICCEGRDQIAAQEVGRLTRFPSLELGVEKTRPAGNCDSGYSCAYSSAISWSSESTPLAKETNPRAVFERLSPQLPNDPLGIGKRRFAVRIRSWSGPSYVGDQRR